MKEKKTDSKSSSDEPLIDPRHTLSDYSVGDISLGKFLSERMKYLEHSKSKEEPRHFDASLELTNQKKIAN